MKQSFLAYFLIFTILVSSVSSLSYEQSFIPPTPPPTPAIQKVVTPGGNLTANFYNQKVNFVGTNGISISANDALKTIFFSGTGGSGNATGLGWFATNNSPNLQNLHFYNVTAGTGVKISVGTNLITISAVNFANATSKICGPNFFISAFNNNTGVLTCTFSGNGTIIGSRNVGHISGSSGVLSTATSTLIQGKNLTAGHLLSLSANSTDLLLDFTGSTGQNNTGLNLGSGTGVYAGMSGTQLTFKGFAAGPGIGLTNNGTTILINNTRQDTNSAQCTNIGTGAGQICAGNNNATQIKAKTIKAGSGIAVTNNANDVTINATGFLTTAIQTINGNNSAAQTINSGQGITVTDSGSTHTIATNFKAVSVTCTNQFISAYNNSTGLYTCSNGVVSLNGISGIITLNRGTASNMTNIINGTTFISVQLKSNILLENGTDQVTVAGKKIYFTATPSRTGINIGSTTNDVTSPSKGDIRINGTSFSWNDNGNVTRSALYSLNGFNNAVNINRGSVTNMSQIINSSGTISIKMKQNVILGNGSAQRVDKQLTLANPQVNGLQLANVAKTGSYSATMFDNVISVNATAGGNPTIITLPSASTNMTYWIEKIDFGTNAVVVKAATGSIDGFQNYTFNNAKQVFSFISNGTGYNTIHANVASLADFHSKGAGMNKWFGTAVIQTGNQTVTVTQNQLYAAQLVLGQPIKLDQIRLGVTAAGAGSNCRMGIYTDNGTAYPSKLISGSDVGAVSTASLGIKTNTFATPLLLPAGLYWLAVDCSTTVPTLVGNPANSFISVIGESSVRMGSQNFNTYYFASTAFGALPANYPAGATVSTAVSPMVQVRAIG